MRSIARWHFQWPRRNHNPILTVTAFLNHACNNETNVSTWSYVFHTDVDFRRRCLLTAALNGSALCRLRLTSLARWLHLYLQIWLCVTGFRTFPQCCPTAVTQTDCSVGPRSKYSRQAQVTAATSCFGRTTTFRFCCYSVLINCTKENNMMGQYHTLNHQAFILS